MHIYFSGIGGTAIGPLALIAHQAGFTVSGSDKQNSQYIDYLIKKGLIDVHIGQTAEAIAEVHAKNPIDWIVYTSAAPLENPNHPEIVFARENGIYASKRDELLNKILKDTNKKMVAIAGTHGKTTTTAMAIWLFNQINLPISYSVGAKISFGEMGQFNTESDYFVYECDEFDRNFLAFNPHLSIITGIDYDHHEIFPTRADYQDAFKQFLDQSEHIIVWQSDVTTNKLTTNNDYTVLNDTDKAIDGIHLDGVVNRRNAWQVIVAVHKLTKHPIDDLIKKMEAFPGLSRRFEKIVPGLYSDYAHTIPKIMGALQTAAELSQNIVVIYEPLTNRRQYYIKQDYAELFNGVKRVYWVASYLAREDPSQAVLSPSELISNMNNPTLAEPAQLNTELKSAIEQHLANRDLVLALSGGGGNSLDEWLRAEFK